MVDVVRRRRGRGRTAERHQPLGDAAAQYASMGWPVCVGAHPYRGTRAAMEPGRACSCDRVGCPAPGAHPVSPAWQMQATVDLNTIRSWWETRPEANVILVTGRVFDVLDVPAAAGYAALGQMEAAGAAVGPVAAICPSAAEPAATGTSSTSKTRPVTRITFASGRASHQLWITFRSTVACICQAGEVGCAPGAGHPTRSHEQARPGSAAARVPR